MSHDYDGNRQFLRSLTDGLTPDPPMTVAEWADTYRILSGRAAAEAGKYRTSRTPYMREIMEALSPSLAQHWASWAVVQTKPPAVSG